MPQLLGHIDTIKPGREFHRQQVEGFIPSMFFHLQGPHQKTEQLEATTSPNVQKMVIVWLCITMKKTSLGVFQECAVPFGRPTGQHYISR